LSNNTIHTDNKDDIDSLVVVLNNRVG